MPDTELRQNQRWFAEANARYYQDNPMSPEWAKRKAPLVRGGLQDLRVAIVGSGAAAWYAARSLLRHPGVEVTMLDKLPIPGGLIEFGVAPDHPSTKAAASQFRWMRDQQARFHLHLSVEVGSDIEHAQLLRHHHAVIYAHGAQQERTLDILGEELVTGAISFVGWYNNHPHFRDLAPDLSGRRVIVAGNGNVALDMARILATPPDALTGSDIAPHALSALRDSRIEEVVIVGRRSAEYAAFTAAELHGLMQTPGVDVIVDPADLEDAPASAKIDLLRIAAAAEPTPGARRVILRFANIIERVSAPGDGALTVAVAARDGGGAVNFEASLVLRAVGFRGGPIPGLPFAVETHTIHNHDRRVVDPETGAVLTGVYTTGWAARGSSGGIGINRTCAETAVDHLMDDYVEGKLTRSLSSQDFSEILRDSCSRAVTIEGAAGYADARHRAGTPTGPAATRRRELLRLWPTTSGRSHENAVAPASGRRA
ncbi:FAD-dependent oxidoreductase [Gordonia polyisoprenivorans]|uniref:FAD-dependent oxidoreductase n=1 Tax=Gordonia polyisoprenivorans TaxID=84595 RepID=UPI002300AB8D|nr:FAD-dependent oxidoreductase [Gordonia polyisoprenivorans]WCB35349.1 FAD-dependent oxidoreductase [Gordonia polyisoprenivorans]